MLAPSQSLYLRRLENERQIVKIKCTKVINEIGDKMQFTYERMNADAVHVFSRALYFVSCLRSRQQTWQICMVIC